MSTPQGIPAPPTLPLRDANHSAMGTYTELSIAGYPVLSSESSVIPEAMTIFQESDKKIFRRRFTERNPLVWGPFDPLDHEEFEEAVEYTCDISKVIDRLDVMGFTLARARQEFEHGLKTEIDKYRLWIEADRSATWFIEHYKLLQGLSFESYLDGLKYVMEQGLRPSAFTEEKFSPLPAVVKYILKRNDDAPFGFFTQEIRCLLRVACEVARKPGLVVQDLTELVQSGHYDAAQPICETETRDLKAGHPENIRRIVVAQHPADAAILSRSLALLHPHLVRYYSFLDFGGTGSPGGAGPLAALVRSLAPAGISNRIVAVFANDTAAAEARKSLAELPLPENIAVIHYPDLDKLRSYPTLGPGGRAHLNVNGLAASIELYLGDDVLREDDGIPAPVQWTGYVESIGRYQGEVMRKARLREAFDRKAQRAEADPAALQAQDWSGLAAILQRIFRAFD